MSRSRRRSGSHRSGSGRLALAQFFLGFIAVMAILAGAIGLRDAQESAKDVLEISGIPNQANAAVPDLREQAMGEVVDRIRIACSIDIGLGLLFGGCAILVNWRPVIACVTGLTLYMTSLAVIASMDMALAMRGLFGRIVVIVALIAAIFAAVRSERRTRQRLRRLEEV